jgi:hypothetical protein
LLKNDGGELAVRSPEKASVGGSIPSLAATFSLTYLAFLNYYFAPRVPLSWAEKDLKLDPPPDGARRFKDLTSWLVRRAQERSLWQAAFEGNPGSL